MTTVTDPITRAFKTHLATLTGIALLLTATWYLVILAASPIQYIDTDFWAHLTAGRYVLTEGALYNPMVYSFLDEARDFINYSTGFQVLTYLSWDWFGPLGTIALRTLCLLGAGWFAARVLLQNKPVRAGDFLAVTVLLGVLFVLCVRGISVRPHIFTYLLIPLFIHTLAYRRDRMWSLPLLTVLWVNTHGVEWIVAAFIGGSWLLVHYLDFRDTGRWDRRIGWLLACLPAVAINPRGLSIFMAPFAINPDLDRFIRELRPVNLVPNFDFSHGLALDPVFLLLLIAVLVSALGAAGRWRQHLWPLLLALGGMALLTRGDRFIWEWLLLSLPLLGVGLTRLPYLPATGFITFVATFILAAQMASTVLVPNIARYPYDRTGLPAGTTAFIQQQGIEGRYLLPPTYAGYAMWELAPDVRIHSTMNFPGYSLLMYYEAVMAGKNPVAIRQFIDKWQPALIAVSPRHQVFSQVAAADGRYVPVFFDAILVLFLDSSQYPEIATTHRLRVVDPFAPDAVDSEQLDAAITELERLISIYPDAPAIVTSLTGYLLAAGETVRARQLIDAQLDRDPFDRQVRFFAGMVAQAEEDFSGALHHYQQLEWGSEEDPVVALKMAECYFMQLDHQNSYRYYRIAINPYLDPAPDLTQYYRYAIVALESGHVAEAERLLAMTRYFDDGSNPVISERVSALLAELGGNTPR